MMFIIFFFFSSRRRHTRWTGDWSSDVCSSDLPDSYGYRPGRSALHAVAKARRRCWENDWAIDMDIRAFFDTVPWDLVLKAVKHHSRESWVLLYVKRWLEAPLQLPDGTISERTMGTPQGSAISPLLANLFMHYAFDAWMARTYPAVTF